MEYSPGFKIIKRIALALIILGFFRTVPENGTPLHEVFVDLQKIGFSVYLLSICWAKRRSKMIRSAIMIGVISLLATGSLRAQDVNYTKQIEAFKQSFADKSIDPVKTYISPELKFFTYPAGATQQILSQVFLNLPALNTLEITESKPGQAQLRYNFMALGERNSKILFDEAGNIIQIELIDNLLEEQAKAQAALAEQIQAPTPGKLGVKYSPSKVEFVSKDGLMVTGNLYEVDPKAPVILLAHSGGGNKYEYADIAPKLNAKGFNALAIDQRSGADFGGQPNETFERAKSKGLGTEFDDAQPDMEAAVNYLAQKYDKKVTLWGSSYSAALSLFIARNNDNLNGMILFSPGDYLAGEKGSLKGKLASIEIPFLITSAQEEAKDISNTLLAGVTLSDSQIHHVPSFEGYHGSRALWQGQKGSEEYWEEVWKMLSIIYPGKLQS